MSKVRLTKTAVEQMKPGAHDIVLWDEMLPGFGVRVKPSGARSYIVQYRERQTGVSRRLTLGQHGPLLTFDQARKQARGTLVDALRGQDPAFERKSARQAPSVSELATEYLEKHAVPKKRHRSVQGDKSMLERIVLPRLGIKKVASVTRRDIEHLHADLRAHPYRANRVLSLLSKMFSLSVHWGWRTDNPARSIPRYPEEKRERWLSDHELCRLCRVLDGHANQRAANVVRLQLLTGARIGEVLAARKADFDLQRGVWTKPSHHTKQKRREHIPLSEFAQTLVEKLLEAADRNSPFLFAGNTPDRPLNRIKKFWASVVRLAALDDYRLHDNRHTYASHLVSSGLSLEIVGRLLGHTSPTTTKRYAHLADDPLRAATDRFSSKISDLLRREAA
jgi:integrase